MPDNVIHDRDRGPEIVGTRITVYNLLIDFLDPTATEAYICRMYHLTPEQVAAARAYILNNPDTVFAEHLKIEARIAKGNPPEVIERATQTRAIFEKFKQWLAEHPEVGAEPDSIDNNRGKGTRTPLVPTFREWLNESETQPGSGS